MFLMSAAFLPQGPPFIEVFQADPISPPSSADEGVVPSRVPAAPPPRIAPRLALPASKLAAKPYTARDDLKEQPRALPLAEPAAAPSRPAPSRSDLLSEVSTPPSSVLPSVLPPPAAPAVATPSTASAIALPAVPLPAPEVPKSAPPRERPIAAPSVEAPPAVSPNPVPRVETAQGLAPSEMAVPAAPSAKPASIAAHEIDVAGELPVAPPSSAPPLANVTTRADTTPSAVSAPVPLARAPGPLSPVRDPVRSALQDPAATPRVTALTPIETAIPVVATAVRAGAGGLEAEVPAGATSTVSAPPAGGLAAEKPGVPGFASAASPRTVVPSEAAGLDHPARAAIGAPVKESGSAVPFAQGGAATEPLAPDSVADTATEVSGERRAVSAPVDRAPGTHKVDGREARRASTDEASPVQNLLKRVPAVITITAPADGLRLGPDDPPVVVVQGNFADPSAALVSLIVNGRRVRVPVEDGRFRYLVPVLEPVVQLRAEGTTGDPPAQSSMITVHGAPSAAPALVLVLDRPAASPSPVDVGATWRANAARVDVPTSPVALKSVALDPAMPGAAFYTRGLQAGVYTLVLRSETSGTAAAAGTLYLLREGQLSVRPLNTPANGFGRVLARLLMPYGVFWDQDDWFTGQSQNAETVTKFRFPDGVSWTERKVNLTR
jgi:hypothetical protein